jgi:hypothetical protein
MIDRALVHRSVERDVFVLDRTPLDQTTLIVDVCIPGFHPRIRRAGSELPTIVLLEVFRQGGFLAAHEQADIPIDWPFVTRAFSVSWAMSPPVVPTHGAIWCELVTHIRTDWSGADECSISWRFSLTEDRQLVATGTAESVARSPRRHGEWRRFAGDTRKPCRATASTVDGHEPRPVIWDERDAFLGDSAPDQISSLVLADAVLTDASPAMHRLEMEFPSPAAPGRPLELQGHEPAEAGIAEFLVCQGADRVASARTFLPGHP